VTGFGLAGHVLDMLGDTLDLQLSLNSVPLLEGVLDLADMGLIPEGAYRNRAAYEDRVKLDELTAKKFRGVIDVLFDAQTSGGLLLAVAPERAEELLRVCRENGFERSAKIGYFTKGKGEIQGSGGAP
jgi:selenide,water dikinase